MKVIPEGGPGCPMKPIRLHKIAFPVLLNESLFLRMDLKDLEIQLLDRRIGKNEFESLWQGIEVKIDDLINFEFRDFFRNRIRQEDDADKIEKLRSRITDLQNEADKIKQLSVMIFS